MNDSANTPPEVILCTEQQVQLIYLQNEQYQSALLRLQGAIYRAAHQLGIDLKAYEFNLERMGFARKPNVNNHDQSE